MNILVAIVKGGNRMRPKTTNTVQRCLYNICLFVSISSAGLRRTSDIEMCINISQPGLFHKMLFMSVSGNQRC